MARRNPNGYGSVTKLKGERSKPYMVRVTMYDKDGNGRQKPIGYAATEEEANILLAKYNDSPWDVGRDKITLAELYAQWEKAKGPGMKPKTLSSLKYSYKYLSRLYGVKYRQIRAYQMQETIDGCGCGYSTQGAIKALWGHLDRFAYEMDVIDKMYSQLITSAPIPETSREPFSPDQVDALWAIADQPWVDTVLIYIYTGFRLNELLDMKSDRVDTGEWLFQGGEKTAAGKNRIVPIHERIRPLVQTWKGNGTEYFLTNYRHKKMSDTTYYPHWREVMKKIGAEGKTPHEARHTFETNLDNAGANRKCIDLLMGHKSKDTGNRVYNHKTVDQLRETVALLR